MSPLRQPPQTKEEFAALVAELKASAPPDHKPPMLYGIAATNAGAGLQNSLGKVQLLHVNYKENQGTAAILEHVLRKSAPYMETVDAETLAKILTYFAPFAGEPNHKNIEALRQAYQIALGNDEKAKAVWIFAIAKVGDYSENPILQAAWQYLEDHGRLGGDPPMALEEPAHPRNAGGPYVNR